MDVSVHQLPAFFVFTKFSTKNWKNNINSNKKTKTKTKQEGKGGKELTLIYRWRLDVNNIEARLLSQEVIFLKLQDEYRDFLYRKSCVVFYRLLFYLFWTFNFRVPNKVDDDFLALFLS